MSVEDTDDSRSRDNTDPLDLQCKSTQATYLPQLTILGSAGHTVAPISKCEELEDLVRHHEIQQVKDPQLFHCLGLLPVQ